MAFLCYRRWDENSKRMAVPFALMYHMFAKKYKVYIFSRKNKLEKNTSTRNMARDLKWAMDAVGIKKADIVEISQGGMIAQYFAIDYYGRSLYQA